MAKKKVSLDDALPEDLPARQGTRIGHEPQDRVDRFTEWVNETLPEPDNVFARLQHYAENGGDLALRGRNGIVTKLSAYAEANGVEPYRGMAADVQTYMESIGGSFRTKADNGE